MSTPSESHVEPGDYRLRVTESTEEQGQCGNIMFLVKFSVLDFESAVVRDAFLFKETSLHKFEELSKACEQYPGDEESHNFYIDLNASDLIGWECEATLGLTDIEGRKINCVQNYLFDEF